MDAATATWSKSQIGTFQECARKHAFSRWEPGENEDRLQQEARRLKNLSNRFLWPGAIVHEELGRILRLLRQGQPVPPLNDLLDERRTKMREMFQESRANPDARLRLFEHEYNVNVPKEAWSSTWSLVEDCLSRFYRSAWFERLKSVGPESWKAVDEILSFTVDETKAFVKIDCALEVDGAFVLIDWKTSQLKSTDGDSLGVAALYAHEVWGAEPSAITAHAVCLLNGRASRISFSEETLMETYIKVQSESALLQGRVKHASPFDLPFPERRNVCERCNFKQLCYGDGRAS